MVTSPPPHERRKDPRLGNNIPIRISQNNGDMVTETANISRSGLYCKVNRYIEPMTKLKVCLLLPLRKNGKDVTKQIMAQGVVVRAEQIAASDDHNIAIFFSEIAQRDAESIADYVSSYLESK
ncbi:MAG: PilZ domain-containing protein [Candidatus Omnitrophica bacterium]|nr:PilZ domain-containing protein [Candidatus Omnitrophota bacterium]